ncbi:hypothetical protein BGX34_000861 [Mortierella sp. NVP85]|nr:hypothetical protein BGX34_000861 [Mortierella sp. NVP85]
MAAVNGERRIIARRNFKSRGSFEINNSDGEQPRSETRCVLDERRLTIRDQIHKAGYEIRASAAASIPRFGITIPSLLDIQQKRDAEKEREKHPSNASHWRSDGIGRTKIDLPPIDENTALFLSTAIMDKDVDLDRISVLEQEIEDLTASTEQ